MPRITIEQAMESAMQCCRAGQLGQAEAMYRQILQHQPRHVQAMNNLGVVLQSMGRGGEAEECYRQVIALSPQQADAHLNLAMLCQQQGKLAEAEQGYRRAAQLNPDLGQAWSNLGLVLQATGRLEQAEWCHARAVALAPDDADAQNNMGALRVQQKRPKQAIECFRRATALRPEHATAHYNLAGALGDCRKVDEAIESYRRAVELRPDFCDGWFSLGTALFNQGRPDEATGCFRQAVALRPERHDAHSALLVALHCDPRVEAAALQREHRLWSERHARPLAGGGQGHAHDRSPGRRLRVGYVSPDLHAHVVGLLLEGLLAHHEHENFHITCYSNTVHPDAVTERLKGHADQWRETSALDDEQLATLIREDGIDILVDLAVHMDHNRLLVFARKPAPVQVTYLGFIGTTGLNAMDYRLTDACLDPPERTMDQDPEKLLRLPGCYWCYTAPGGAPEVGAAPAAGNGWVTFASFNNLAKVNADVLELWSRVLHSTGQSRLLMVCTGGERNRHVREAFERCGVEPGRVRLVERRSMEHYWQLYGEVDIALDPFPYNGGVTSMDALWMGVPVVSLAGQRAMARAGVTLLTHAGLPELIAQTPEQYVRIAAALAGDLPRLSELRRTLRGRMQRSTLMDGPAFARGVENAYRQIWHRWCQS